MSTPHTPEPWKVYTEGNHDVTLRAVAPPMLTIAMITGGLDDIFEAGMMGPTPRANAERIVSCVNACTGMADPEATITALREALKEIVGHRNETIDGAGHRYTFDYRSPMAERARAALKLAGER